IVAARGEGRQATPKAETLLRKRSGQRIPLGLFHLPLILTWIAFAVRYRSLTLPTVANPSRRAGGLWGEAKSDCFLEVAAGERRWIADLVSVTRSRAARTLYADLHRTREALCAGGLTFPLIAKPDIGRHAACRIADVAELREYLRHFPGGETLILQRLVPHAGKAAVLYARLPGASRGRLLSLTLRTDGVWRDGPRHITPALEARLDAIARSMREFYCGRFDLRFASIDALERGEDFVIVEICGLGGVLDRAWDPAMPLAEIYRRMI